MYLGELNKYHVGQSHIYMNGGLINVGSAIGFVQFIDIGKRVYITDGVVQVENNEQRDRRLAKNA